MFKNRDKRQRVDKVIEEAISMRETGLEIDYESLERRHADLMPLLGERLRRLKRIQSAVQMVRQPPSSDDEPNLHQQAMDEDIRVLRKALRGYRVLHRIEYGGQGVVYKAIQLATKRPVALKILIDGPLASEHQLKRFAREVEFTGRLRHPNIVTIYESGVARGRPFFAMEYIQGLPVDQYVLSTCTSVREIVRIMRDVCLAVSAAHQRGIIHRDLKPANILVDTAAIPHVLDFGLAKDITDDSDFSRMSMPGQVVGTPPYLSPEQVEGEDEIDVRADIYTLGVVLFELLSGQSPYPATDDPRILREHIRTFRPIGLRSVLLQPISNADDLEKIVSKSLEKDKSLRYQAAAALADDLQRFLNGDAVSAKDHNRMYLLKKTARRFRIPIAITGVFIAVLFASLIAVTSSWRKSDMLSKLYKAGLEMGATVRMASVARDEGRVDQAINMFEQAIQLAVFDEGEDYDDHLVMRHVYNAKYRLADLLMDVGRPEEAQPHVVAAEEIIDSMLAIDPTDEEWKLRGAFTRLLGGKAAQARGDYEMARKQFSEAANAFARFAKQSPDNVDHHLNHGNTLGWLGMSYRELSQVDAAYECFVEAREVLQRIVNQDPQNTEHQLQLARSEARLGYWHSLQSQPEQATEIFSTAKQRLTHLRDQGLARTMAREIGDLEAYVDRSLKRLADQASASSARADR